MSLRKQQLEEKINSIKENVNKLPEHIIYRDNFNFEKLKLEVEKVIEIKKDMLSEQQSYNPVLFHKYLRILLDFLEKYRYYDRLLKRMKALKLEWYKLFNDITVDKKGEIDIYINGDEDILMISEKLDETDIIITYLKSVCDRIKNRGFAFKNIIAWENFKNGN